MRKKISLLLAFVLFLSLAPHAYADSSPFTDVAPDFWAYDAIVEAYNDGVMTGTTARTFSPSDDLNMAQFVTVLTRAFYNEDVVNSTRGGAWPNQNYDAASKHNLFTGLTRYAGELDVTREAMAQMMYNVMVDKCVVLPNETEIQMTMNKIVDISVVDSSFRTGVAVCYYLELLTGVDAYGTFAPTVILDRAQTAVIYTRLKRAINLLASGPSAPGTTNPGTTNPGTAQTPSGATLTNGMPVTEENVLALIEEYHNGKAPVWQKAINAGFTTYVDFGHADSKKYDAYNPPYTIKGFGSGTECAKFAFAFWEELFGDAPYREVTNLEDIRPGDLLRYTGHWAIATSAAKWDEIDGKRYLMIQEVGGGPSGGIGYGIDHGNTWGVINNDPTDNWSYTRAYTKYPE